MNNEINENEGVNNLAKKLIKYALNEKKLMMFAFVMLLFATVAELTSPLIIIRIIDNYSVTD